MQQKNAEIEKRNRARLGWVAALERAGLDLRAKVTNCLWHYYTIPIFNNSCFLISSQLGLAGLVLLNQECLGASSMHLGSRGWFAKHVLIVVGGFFLIFWVCLVQLKSAREMAKRTVIGRERVIYSTEKDLAVQDYEAQEWEQRLKERS